MADTTIGGKVTPPQGGTVEVVLDGVGNPINNPGQKTPEGEMLITALSMQFYNEDDQDFPVDGEYEIGGVPFFVNNRANAISMRNVRDEGLFIECNNANTDWNGAVRTGAMIGVLLENLSVPLRYGEFSEIRVWLNYGSNRQADFEATRLGLETKQASFDPSTYWVQMVKNGINSGQPSGFEVSTIQGQDGANFTIDEDDPDGLSYDVIGFRWQNPNLFETYTSPFPAGLPPKLSNAIFRAVTSMSAQAGGGNVSRIRANSPLAVGCAATTGNTDGNLVISLAELIVQFVPIIQRGKNSNG